MEAAELDALLQQARAGERAAKALEDATCEVESLKGSVRDLEAEVVEMKGTVAALRTWLDNQQKLAQAEAARGPFVWVYDIFDNPKFRVAATALLAALATAVTNYLMARAGVSPPAPAPEREVPALSAPAPSSAGGADDADPPG